MKINFYVVILCSSLFIQCSEKIIDRWENDRYMVKVEENGSLLISGQNIGEHRFKPHFTILMSDKDPKRAMHWGEFNDPNLKTTYNVWTWGRDTSMTIDSDLHVEDGYNPETDQAYGAGRTADYFNAAPLVQVTAHEVKIENNKLQWIFPEHPAFKLSAEIELSEGDTSPKIKFNFTPTQDGWYSIGYTGTPETAVSDLTELWQPLIWNEKRMPDNSYLTDAFRCPLPATMVTQAGVTVSVVADPIELPFEYAMPRPENTHFGVILRNERGNAQPMIFAPVLGGPKSKMESNTSFSFLLHLVLYPGGCVDTYEHVARNIYGFHDYRKNTTTTLNETFENMIDYGMSKSSEFVDDLRGCNYSTDVPGAVKNVSALHPIGIAMVTDNEEIYKKRARPLIEFGLSREKFLFLSNHREANQNPSWLLKGPGYPLSELAALYQLSGRRLPYFLEYAQDLYKSRAERALNLDKKIPEHRWQNAMALYQATGIQKWLDEAKSMADDYIEKRLNNYPTTFNNIQNWRLFFWQAYTPRWAELYELYQTTNQKRYLDAAINGLRSYTRYLYLCPVIPDSEILVNHGGKAPLYRDNPERFPPIYLPEEIVPAWQVSEIGLGAEAAPTSKGPRGILNAHYAPLMLRMAFDCHDNFLHDIARSAVIGRYTTFPGYHMNTARGTAYQKSWFPYRSHHELNSTTSMHYNHIWPFIALVLDYLVADVYYKSQGTIDFPSQYVEGYAYLQGKIYGDRPGKFYDGEAAWLWMPKGLLKAESKQLNYIAARGQNKLYLALTNQSYDTVSSWITIDKNRLSLGENPVRIWMQNKEVEPTQLVDGKIEISVAPAGLTVIMIEDVDINPVFQNKLGKGKALSTDSYTTLEYGGTHAFVLSMGENLGSVYIYLKATFEDLQNVKLSYKSDEEWYTLVDNAYPFEFTVDIKDGENFTFYVEGTDNEGEVTKSEQAVLKW